MFLESMSESISLESHEGFVDYVPAGKLKGKTALIIDGEYVLPFVAGLMRYIG